MTSSRLGPRKRIRLFNVKYSPNLGDGLLSECLEMAMWECGGDPAGTYSADLSARTRYGRGDASRTTVLKVLDRLPGALRPLATSLPRRMLMMRKWRPHYERSLAGADAVAVGGGNLFTDMDLNFPVKVAAALEQAAARNLPAAIYGVGVSSVWSPAGKRIIRRALERSRPIYVSVRDEASKRHFDDMFAAAAGREARVVRDPGLMIGRFAPPRVRAPDAPLGLCITSSVAIRYHSAETVSDAQIGAWYVNLCRALSQAGRPIVAFTNGSPEDELALDEIADALRAAAVSGFERRRLDTPSDLVSLIASSAGLVAHRMHAVIAAVSIGVPVFALLWDEKVTSFIQSMGMEDSMAFVRAGNEAEVARRLIEIVDAPLGYDRAAVVDEAFGDARGLYLALAGLEEHNAVNR